MSTLVISTAEPSGDLQAAALAVELKRRHPEMRILGAGGHAMRGAGVEVFIDSTSWGVIGPSAAIGLIPTLLLAYRKMRKLLLEVRPDLLIVIDSPAAHYRLAGFAQRHGIKTMYYFPPSQWTRSSKRLHQIHQRVTSVVTAFRFNAEQYRKNGLEVGFFGHPLVDIIGPPPALEQAQQALSLKPGRYIALLPGSRTQELRYLTPVLLQAAALLRQCYPDVEFLIPCATPRLAPFLAQQLGTPPPFVHVLQGQAREALAASRVALIASGTASLEAALLRIPHVVFYKGSSFDWTLYRLLRRLKLIRVDRFGLVNLVLDEDVMPEFLQTTATPENLAREAMRLFEEGPERERMLECLDRARASVGEPGVVGRVADHVEGLLRGSCSPAR